MYYTAFTFQDNFHTKLHVTHKFLGSLDVQQVEEIKIVLDEWFSFHPFMPFQVLFDRPAKFGPNKSEDVLLCNPKEKYRFLPGLRRLLDHYRRDDYPEYSPHVTSGASKIDLQITGYIFAQGAEVLGYYGVPNSAYPVPKADYMIGGGEYAEEPNDLSGSFDEYNKLFMIEAKRLELETDTLSNGALVARLERGQTASRLLGRQEGCNRLSVVGGMHGDERSGPMIVLNWLKRQDPEKLRKNPISLWICPLFNNDGWDGYRREWKGVDLNRAFKSLNAPAFVQEFKQQVLDFPPMVYLDFHEDSTASSPYFFHNSKDVSDYSFQLKIDLDAGYHSWLGKEDDGNAEQFVRDAGCLNAMTVELASAMKMKAKILWGVKAISWFYQRLSAPAAKNWFELGSGRR
jgi:hypothetical protein